MQRMPNLFLVVAVCSLLWPPASAAQLKQTRRVLVFSEIGRSSPGVALIEQELHSALDEKSPYDVEFYSESLETTLFPDEASQNKLRNLYIRKYATRKPDLIIAAGPSPIQFMLNAHKRFFPDIPIVFCASSEEQAGRPNLDSRFTGVWMTIEAAKTVEAALRMQPSTRSVVVVGGVAPFDKHVEDIVRESLRSYEGQIEFTYLTDLDIQTLCERLKHLPQNAIILYTTISEDAAGKHFINVRQSVPMVAKAANVPVYAMADVFIGQGFVGGYVASYAAQGQVAADIAVKILEGTKPQEIPVVKDTNVYMFDARALQRWGLDEKMLPPGSSVLYREPTLTERYKGEMIGTLLVFGALVVLVGYLLIERRRLALVEHKLEAEARFERLISELSSYFIDLPADKIDAEIEQTLKRLVNYLAVDRVNIFEFTIDKTELVLTHSSAATRDTSAATPHRYGTNKLPWYTRKLLNNEPIAFTNMDQLVEATDGDKGFLQRQGMQSNVAIPLEAEGSVLGCLSFVTVYESRVWSSRLVDQLKIVGQVFANALMRKRTDEALVRSEMLKGAILTSISSGLAVLDQRGEIVTVNSRWKEFSRVYGTSRDMELQVGTNYLEVCQRALVSGTAGAAQALAGVKAVLQGESQYFETEYAHPTPDGQRWFSMRVTPLQAVDGGAVISFNDITARKLAEQEREELAGRLINAEEQERSRLARELHDDFNQRLAVLAVDLERCAEMIKHSPAEASERMLELWNRASEIGADLHTLSHQLHSSTLESLGLVLGVNAFCAEFAEQQGIQVDFVYENIPRSVAPQIALCLFRIVQEGLRNVKKHSGSSRAEVRLEGIDEAIHLSLFDRGAGFDRHNPSTQLGLGVRSMEERLRLVGGRFELQSDPMQGTRIDAWVPLKPAMVRAS
jgi:signal transduction histidine kinase/ABC-type uncharacterized transport system substrate-binding protein